jgi:serine/threonine-protein kinase
MSETLARLLSALADRYRVERELGAGGMATVYLAEDLKHRRRVAVKVLKPELAASIGAERFLREIETTANLRHPHILPLYDSGDADGFLFYVMPLVEGETLRARLTRERQLPIDDALRIAREVADALSYAHARGVIHRDIKPENILLESGHAVVADFGIARAVRAAGGDSLTLTGMSIGTPMYMSPEQATGDPDLDGRSDLYSLACVLFEMLAGQPPFTGPTAEAITRQHLVADPPPVTNLRPAVPAAVMSTLQRALAKNPADRFNPVAQFAEAIQPSAIATAVAPAPARATSGSLRRRTAIAVTLGVLALVVIAGAVWRRSIVSAPAATGAGSANFIAVLPFVNTGGDAKDEYFSDGMTDELTHALSKLPELRLAGRSSSFAFKGKSVPAPEIGKALGVGAIIEGAVRRSGDRLRVTVQLTSTSDGRMLWSDSYERAGTDVFAVQDAFTAAIVQALTPLLGKTPTTTAAATGVDTRGTKDPDAYDLYLRGRYYWAQRGAGPLDTALAFFEQAVKRDPSFARGWAGIALTQVIRPNYNNGVEALSSFDASEAAARKALTLDTTLADAHASIGMVRMRRLDLRGAASELEAARRIEPQNANAHHWSGIFYGVMGDTLHEDEEMRIALSLDPLSATTVNSRATMLFARRRFTEANNLFRQVAQLSSAFRNISRPIAGVWIGKADSVATFRRQGAQGIARGGWGLRVFVYAAAGWWEDARRLRDTIEHSRAPGVLLVDRGLAAIAFGEYARAAELVATSMEREGALANVFFSQCDPVLDPLRDQPAFTSLLRRHHLPACPYRSPWPIKAPPPGVK